MHTSPAANLADPVLALAGRQPSAAAVITGEATVSFAHLNNLVGKAAARLRQSNGETFGFRFKDQFLHLVFVLGAFRCSAPHVSLFANWPDSMGVDLVAQTGAGILFGDEAWTGGGEMHVVSLAALEGDAVPANETLPQSTRDGRLLYVLGSGTTGKPRIICYDATNLAAMIARDLSVRPIGFQERYYSLVRFEYFTGKRRTLGCLAAGGTVIFTEFPVPATAIYDQLGADHLSMVVGQAEAILDKLDGDGPRFPKLKSLVVGSSPVSETLRQRLRDGLSPNLFIGYGTNEFGEATFTGGETQMAHPGSLGFPAPGVELKIAGPDGTALPAGTTGEIHLRAEGMFSGYLNDPEATNAAFADGWYRPGDLGALSEDGALVFQGRVDDLMIRYGTNIYPREIEQTLEAIEGVRHAAAFPLTSKNEWQIPVAAVTLVDGSGTQADLDHFCNELTGICDERLGPKAPAHIWIIKHMPRNEAGKIRKNDLAALVAKEMNR
ncbi:MAG: long-chain fatty acid--CoA ligase [Rhodospirillaceae bacterium]|nr:long-chain fatty acid--CoA ligase [Rhodospirillaceae bacterium]MBT5841050.1 long-chain fatty acid--CoA ligase [Rhodospirillaceae bacterium]